MHIKRKKLQKPKGCSHANRTLVFFFPVPCFSFVPCSYNLLFLLLLFSLCIDPPFNLLPTLILLLFLNLLVSTDMLPKRLCIGNRSGSQPDLLHWNKVGLFHGGLKMLAEPNKILMHGVISTYPYSHAKRTKNYKNLMQHGSWCL